MKKLEQALAKAKPEKAGPASLNDMLDIYLGDNSNRRTLIDFIQKGRPDPKHWINNWIGIQAIIGTLYRLEMDGHPVLNTIGLTQQESEEFKTLCLKIREKIGAGAVERKTKTQMLYDKVSQAGF